MRTKSHSLLAYGFISLFYCPSVLYSDNLKAGKATGMGAKVFSERHQERIKKRE